MNDPFPGITAATSLAQLAALRRNARLQEAINLKTAARIFSVHPPPEEDKMLAGGNITVNNGSSRGPWVIAAAIAVLSMVVLWPWLTGYLRSPAPATAPASPAAPAAPAAAPNSDYIEFYRP